MDLHTRLNSRLTGDAADMQRRQPLLALLLAAFERGDADDAAATLGGELANLERSFTQHLNDLHQLL